MFTILIIYKEGNVIVSYSNSCIAYTSNQL